MSQEKRGRISSAAQRSQHADSSMAESVSCMGGMQRTTCPRDSSEHLSLNGDPMHFGGSDMCENRVGRMPATMPEGSMMLRGRVLNFIAHSRQVATAEMVLVSVAVIYANR